MSHWRISKYNIILNFPAPGRSRPKQHLALRPAPLFKTSQAQHGKITFCRSIRTPWKISTQGWEVKFCWPGRHRSLWVNWIPNQGIERWCLGIFHLCLIFLRRFLNYPLFSNPKILCSGARKREVSWNGTNLHNESIHPQYHQHLLDLVTLMTHLPPVMHLLEIAIITSISFQRRYVASAYGHLVRKGAVCHFDCEKKNAGIHSWYPNRMTTFWYCKPVEKKKFPCICATPSTKARQHGSYRSPTCNNWIFSSIHALSLPRRRACGHGVTNKARRDI